jgi:hypothetical protein
MTDQCPPPPVGGAANVWVKLAAAICGMILVIVSVILLDPGTFLQTALMAGIASALAAEGLAIVASLFLPAAIEVNGKPLKPFGLSIKASGGAAVFVVLLAYFYFSK